jgi:ankyrin repeat protein
MIIERRKSAWHAAEFGDIDAIRTIYDEQFSNKPAAVDEQDERGFTAIAWASRNGHQQIVSFLIEEKKCNIEKPSFGGLRPLHHACKPSS